MRYELKRNINGQVEQCDNADGNNNIYAHREEISKLAIENLQKPTPGKLGTLSNYQFFNFQIDSFSTGTQDYIEKQYNQTSTFPANATQTIMFGVDGLSNKALYYNVVYLNASPGSVFGTGSEYMRNPSLISFYPLRNIEGSTSSLGTKIPQPAPLYGNGGGTVTFTTDGNVFGNQRITCDIVGEQGNYYQNNNLKGVRCSGLALSQIFVQFDTAINTAGVKLDVVVGVDMSSVSTTY